MDMSVQLHHAYADLGDVTLHYVTAGQGAASGDRSDFAGFSFGPW